MTRYDVVLWAIMVAAVGVGIGYTLLFPRPRRRRQPVTTRAKAVAEDSRYEVRFDDDELVVYLDGAPRERVAWSRMLLVGIRIDDAYLPQPWWLLADSAGGCTFPSDARGWQEAMTHLFAPSPHPNGRGGDPR